MSSEIVFEAKQNVHNRYLLCRLMAATVRQRHHVSESTRDAVLDAFAAIGGGLYSDQVAEISKSNTVHRACHAPELHSSFDMVGARYSARRLQQLPWAEEVRSVGAYHPVQGEPAESTKSEWR